MLVNLQEVSVSDALHGIESAAERLQTPVGTLRYWRHKGIGPRSARIGRRVVYRESDLEAFIEQQFAEQAGDPQPAA
jgi:DNA-binding transcriptional MerR regulator